jgi:glycosyltransferase involved in cell wall biosynthesis
VISRRVVVMLPWASRSAGGLFDAVRNLTLEIKQQHCYLPCVIGFDDPNFGLDRPLWGTVDVNVTRVRGPRIFGYAPGMLTTLQSENPHVLHVHGLWMYTSVAAIRWAQRERPYVVSPHGMLDPWALNNSRLKKRISAVLYENRHLRGAHCLHALNRAEAEAMRAYGLKNPICVIPNGVELPEGPKGKPVKNDRTLLYLGRLHPKKGLPLLVAAWSKVQRKADELGWRLMIAGWDQIGHQSELLALAAKLHAGSRIEFVGPRFGEAKSAVFREASAFILPSLSEGLPMSVLEAWSWRLPVLMTKDCNLPEGASAGAAIMMAADIGDISEALIKLFELDDAEREAMGARGRRLVEDQFQWPGIAQQMTQVYDWILGRGPRPSCVLN